MEPTITQEVANEIMEEAKLPLPEARGIAFTELHGTRLDENGNEYPIKINVTARAKSATLAVIELFEAIEFARNAENLKPYAIGKNEPKPANKVENPFGDVAVVSAPQTVVPQQSGNTESAKMTTPSGIPCDGVMDIIKMKVAPRQDGKSRLDFWMAGREYPDLTAVMMPEKLAQMMSPTGKWTPQHFSQVAEFSPLNYRVYWVYSKEVNKAGNHYKNIVTVERLG